jgi:hypothetical protein
MHQTTNYILVRYVYHFFFSFSIWSEAYLLNFNSTFTGIMVELHECILYLQITFSSMYLCWSIDRIPNSLLKWISIPKQKWKDTRCKISNSFERSILVSSIKSTLLFRNMKSSTLKFLKSYHFFSFKYCVNIWVYFNIMKLARDQKIVETLVPFMRCLFKTIQGIF